MADEIKIETLEDLLKVKHIGPKTVLDIRKIYNSIEEVKQALRDNKMPIKDDAERELRKVLLGE